MGSLGEHVALAIPGANGQHGVQLLGPWLLCNSDLLMGVVVRAPQGNEAVSCSQKGW